MSKKIKITAAVNAVGSKVWEYYTHPKHIVHWNFADPSWHCPTANNDMRIGGIYKARMEAKDGSFGFDFEAAYTSIEEGKSFTYEFGERVCQVNFSTAHNQTMVVVEFDPEQQHPLEMQQAGWQAILNNFKQYVENN